MFMLGVRIALLSLISGCGIYLGQSVHVQNVGRAGAARTCFPYFSRPVYFIAPFEYILIVYFGYVRHSTFRYDISCSNILSIMTPENPQDVKLKKYRSIYEPLRPHFSGLRKRC